MNANECMMEMIEVCWECKGVRKVSWRKGEPNKVAVGYMKNVRAKNTNMLQSMMWVESMATT